MGNLQYIGARYVPKFYENPDTGDITWKSDVAYEPLTVVKYNDDTYTSKIPVPGDVGNPADNPTYWAKTADYNAALSTIQSEVEDLQNAVSDEGMTDTLNRLMNDIPVNRWYPDNDDVVVSGFDPANITFNLMHSRCPDFVDFMRIFKWTPSSDVAKEEALRTVHPQTNNATPTFIKNGVSVVRTTAGDSGKYVLIGISKPQASNCIKFKVDARNGDTGVGRTGIALTPSCYIYFNNATKQVYYETQGGSWSPTALSADTFTDASTLEFLVFLRDTNKAAVVYVAADGGNYQYVGIVTNSGANEIVGNLGVILLAPSDGKSVSLWDLEVGFSYLSIADTKYIHYDDTTPYILDNKAYMTATLRTEALTYTGILRHTLGADDLELVGVITSNDEIGGIATDMCFDRKNKRFICAFRQASGLGTNVISYSVSKNNNLFGVVNFDSTVLDTVDVHTKFGNYLDDEDPAVCFFDGHWYFAINRKTDSNYNTFYVDIFKTTGSEFDINDFEYQATAVNSSLTGPSFFSFAGVLYLVAGDGSNISAFYANTGSLVSNFPISVDSRVWGNLIAVNRGNKTKLYLTTFDRTTYTSSSWGYGDLLMFESDIDIPANVAPNTIGTR